MSRAPAHTPRDRGRDEIRFRMPSAGRKKCRETVAEAKRRFADCRLADLKFTCERCKRKGRQPYVGPAGSDAIAEVVWLGHAPPRCRERLGQPYSLRCHRPRGFFDTFKLQQDSALFDAGLEHLGCSSARKRLSTCCNRGRAPKFRVFGQLGRGRHWAIARNPMAFGHTSHPL